MSLLALSGRAGNTFEYLLSRKTRQRLLSPSVSAFDPQLPIDGEFCRGANGPHDVVAYGRRPKAGLGETASQYEP